MPWPAAGQRRGRTSPNLAPFCRARSGRSSAVSWPSCTQSTAASVLYAQPTTSTSCCTSRLAVASRRRPRTAGCRRCRSPCRAPQANSRSPLAAKFVHQVDGGTEPGDAGAVFGAGLKPSTVLGEHRFVIECERVLDAEPADCGPGQPLQAPLFPLTTPRQMRKCCLRGELCSC